MEPQVSLPHSQVYFNELNCLIYTLHEIFHSLGNGEQLPSVPLKFSY